VYALNEDALPQVHPHTLQLPRVHFAPRTNTAIRCLKPYVARELYAYLLQQTLLDGT